MSIFKRKKEELQLCKDIIEDYKRIKQENEILRTENEQLKSMAWDMINTLNTTNEEIGTMCTGIDKTYKKVKEV